jgi:hypothetical protein
MLDGLVVTVITKPPDAYRPNARPTVLTQIQRLRDSGIKVVEEDGVRRCFAVIDECVVWFGGVSPLGMSY